MLYPLSYEGKGPQAYRWGPVRPQPIGLRAGEGPSVGSPP